MIQHKFCRTWLSKTKPQFKTATFKLSCCFMQWFWPIKWWFTVIKSSCLLSSNKACCPLAHADSVMQTATTPTYHSCVCLSRLWTATGWCCRRWRKLQRPSMLQGKVHKSTCRQTQITFRLFPKLTQFFFVRSCISPGAVHQLDGEARSKLPLKWRDGGRLGLLPPGGLFQRTSVSNEKSGKWEHQINN